MQNSWHNCQILFDETTDVLTESGIPLGNKNGGKTWEIWEAWEFPPYSLVTTAAKMFPNDDTYGISSPFNCTTGSVVIEGSYTEVQGNIPASMIPFGTPVTGHVNSSVNKPNIGTKKRTWHPHNATASWDCCECCPSLSTIPF